MPAYDIDGDGTAFDRSDDAYDDRTGAVADPDRLTGAQACRLGDTVLRASTAGVAALSVLSAGARWR